MKKPVAEYAVAAAQEIGDAVFSGTRIMFFRNMAQKRLRHPPCGECLSLTLMPPLRPFRAPRAGKCLFVVERMAELAVCGCHAFLLYFHHLAVVGKKTVYLYFHVGGLRVNACGCALLNEF